MILVKKPSSSLRRTLSRNTHKGENSMSFKQDSVPHLDASKDLAHMACAEEQCTDDDAALSHAAHVVAQFVIQRWQDGSRQHCADLALPPSQSARARWLVKTQQGLQDWVERGGFSLPVDAHDAAALSGSGIVRPILYQLAR